MNLIRIHIIAYDLVYGEIAVQAAAIQAIMFADGSAIVAQEPRHQSVREELQTIVGVTVFPHPHSHVPLGALSALFANVKPTAPNPSHTIYEAFQMLGMPGLLHQDA